ncbi:MULTISPECIES: Rieske (2Fe-2S) protein [unclassified Bradyrhizobium]|uniref:Rieske (2Fe-2S) protein n=1 Tax=unclassified Bradyrhizobium TaxID=2631580 RepID=UPI001CD27D02|nr:MULTISPECIES: Rieske (2Fe-2S) protein [unclassified Bradyrhizobium]MCA1501564.1 Rieske (2Fe-2S) protein [Bradyrhizobium sp. NBAIM14]MCA1534991.1 Rieske (2Fe-2S) protein [Bradyrhizobium sp. NBAIM03]
MCARPILVGDEAGWIDVCDLDRLKAETIVRVAGRDLLVIWNEGNVVACERACPHEQADLALGQVTAGRLDCPRHAASFDLRDGEISAGWPSRPLRLYPVRITGKRIWIEMQERQPGR